MHQILFVCTGNYYRSRFAEILFNRLVESRHLKARAFSRGLEVFKEHNTGPLSVHTIAYLLDKGIDMRQTSVFPTQLKEEDLGKASRIILMDEKEHFPMMQRYFPEWSAQVEYWHFEDIQFINPQYMLPSLEERVQQLAEKLSESSH
jgi:protein-tyrosine phosphatase